MVKAVGWSLLLIVAHLCTYSSLPTNEARGCSRRGDCNTCVRSPECGWCEAENACLPGTLEEPALVTLKPSKCIQHPQLWHFEEGSCNSVPRAVRRRGPMQKDPLFNADGPSIESLIPQLQSLFPDVPPRKPAVTAHSAKEAARAAMEKAKNGTLLDENGRPLTTTQVRRIELTRQAEKLKAQLDSEKRRLAKGDEEFDLIKEQLKEAIDAEKKETQLRVAKHLTEQQDLKQKLNASAQLAAEALKRNSTSSATGSAAGTQSLLETLSSAPRHRRSIDLTP